MKIVCLECHRELGVKAPFDDDRVTHTICPECIEKRSNEPGKGEFRDRIGKKFRGGG